MSDSAPIIDEVLEPPVDALRQLCYANPDFAKRYEGWEVIGQGGFATVVKVSLLGEPVALKVFTNLNEEGRARFRSEFASTVRLNSPHLVRTYSAFDTGSIAWIEMEAVDGPNLEDELARRERDNTPLSMEEALQIGIALASVVAEAHELGIVHRDIKPANVLLPRSRKPMAKLGDFGIARFVDAAKLTATGGFPGTPKWAAPEVFALRPQVGPPADVYSLSLCLFALFTGNRYPWVLGDDVAPGAFMAAHLKNRPLRMKFLERSLPEDLDRIVAKGLEKKPRDRPGASDVKMVLSSCRSRITAQPAPPEPVDRAVRGGLGRRRRAARASLVAALGLFVLAWVFRAWRAEERGSLGSIPPIAAPAATAGASVAMHPHEVSARQANGPEKPEVTVGVRQRFLRIQNRGQRLSDVAIVVVGAHGQRHSYQIPGNLDPFESAEIALDSLSPATSKAEALAEAYVSANGPVGRFEGTVPLESVQ